jgi:predicted transcriptional regulator
LREETIHLEEVNQRYGLNPFNHWRVLSSENRGLLKIINKGKPESLKELELVSGRKRNNLSRTLKTFSRYGIVKSVKPARKAGPVVKATDFDVEFGLNTP